MLTRAERSVAPASGALERAYRIFLDRADVRLDGARPEDLVVHDRRLWSRVLRHGSLGLGEAYMDGWWDCEELDALMTKLVSSPLFLLSYVNPTMVQVYPRSFVDDGEREERASVIAEAHYDLGNDLFEAMLGRTMAYTCGYWRDASTLDEAQEAKFDLVCRKLGLERGMRVLDIGCGFGGFGALAARRYGVDVLGVTVSTEQARYYRERLAHPDALVEVLDYRKLRDRRERFDRIVSLGMFEHVGHRHHREYMEIARGLLAPGGLFLLHTIGLSFTCRVMDPWLGKYIFPVGQVPSRRQIERASRGLFAVRDWHELGPHYDTTLLAWHRNFEDAWPSLRATYGPMVDGRFYRMWRFYLLTCAALFRAGVTHLWQVVLSDRDAWTDYEPVR